MEDAQRIETSRLSIHGRTDDEHNPAAVSTGLVSTLAGHPSPATATRGFMSSSTTTPAKRAGVENSDYTVDNKRAQTQRRLTFPSLPQDIVSRITAALPFKEAVRISAVCSKLRRAWTYHPNLDLGVSATDGSVVPTIVRVRGRNAKRNQSSDRYKRMVHARRFVDMVNVILMKLQHRGFTLNRGCSKVLVALHESLMLKTASFQSRVEENLGCL
ncbi:hypothetical protein PR202_ga19976 [Eleusine coracana subsp. coracana]|uniref:F-box domain-containing protein n=1 Tax=Eleusine coracana subsp. coracana TaxID=191504 RepID=A0AAV5CWP4_ELECO|nr:hypothetical protein PR202_ga19976 [Eleusine coracana subsp. coracana]